MKLPECFTTITPFSKYLTLTILVLFPFIGFYLGIQYQKPKIKELQVTIDQQQNQIANFAIGIRNSTPEGHQEFLVRLASTFKCEQYGRLSESYLYDKYTTQDGDTLERIASNLLGDPSLASMIRRDNYNNVLLREEGADPKLGEILNIRKKEYLKFFSVSAFAGPVVEIDSKSINVAYGKDSFRNAYIYPTTTIEIGPNKEDFNVGDCVFFINDESLNSAILIKSQDL